MTPTRQKGNDMTYSTIPNDKLRELCIKNNWFTCGSNSQYEKLFQANKDRFTADQIATIIWVCSDNADRNTILATLKAARAAWTRSMVSIPDKSSEAKAGYLTAIEVAETMNELLDVRSRFSQDETLPYDDFVDCFNAFKLKRSELRGEIR